MREFETGATRDDDTDKFDYEGFLNPLVLERFAAYMHKHRKQADGKLRDSSNWQSGMSKACYIKSGLRHVHDWWMEHRGYTSREGLQDALCAVMFNVMGYLLEDLRGDKVPVKPCKTKAELLIEQVNREFEEPRQYLAESNSDKSYYNPNKDI